MVAELRKTETRRDEPVPGSASTGLKAGLMFFFLDLSDPERRIWLPQETASVLLLHNVPTWGGDKARGKRRRARDGGDAHTTVPSRAASPKHDSSLDAAGPAPRSWKPTSREKGDLPSGFRLPSAKGSLNLLTSPDSGSCVCALHVGSHSISFFVVGRKRDEKHLVQAQDEASGFTCMKLVRTQAELVAGARARCLRGSDAIPLGQGYKKQQKRTPFHTMRLMSKFFCLGQRMSCLAYRKC